VVEWYGTKRQEHFSDALLLSNRDNISDKERESLDVFINDLNFPAIARATIIDNIEITKPQDFEAILKGLEDPSPLVRFHSLQKFDAFSLQDRLGIALKHANDTTKLVRIGAAKLLLGVDINTLTDIDVSGLKKSRNELEEMLNSNADFSLGRMQLADYYLQNNDINNAIKHYKVALQKDSLLIPAYSNLASAYSLNGQPEEALSILNISISKQPDLARTYYLRALLYFEIQQPELAVKDLNQAIKLEPSNTRSMYNLATYYYQNKNLSEGEKTIKKALKLEKNNQDYKYLLALIYQEQGKINEAQIIMQELNANQ